MGKYRFRLSDMVPNAWFYKLRDMGHSRRRNQSFSIREDLAHRTSQLARKSFTSPYSPPKRRFAPHRPSYYYSTTVVEASENLNSPVHLIKRRDGGLSLDSPRKSKRSHRRNVKVPINCSSPERVSTSALIKCNCSVDRAKLAINPTNIPTQLFEIADDVSARNSVVSSTVNMTRSSSKRFETTKMSSKVIEVALSPVRTRLDRTSKDHDNSFYAETKRPQLKIKRASQSVHRIRTRVVSPRVATKSATRGKRLNKDLKDSLAVMKHSSDPQRDFMESMIEMIIANNMRSSSDLEELLACYLSLNVVDYHSVIVKVFKEVWLDLNKLKIIE